MEPTRYVFCIPDVTYNLLCVIILHYGKIEFRELAIALGVAGKYGLQIIMLTSAN